MLKYKNENGNFIQLLDEDYIDSYNYMHYGTTAPIGNKIWCDTSIPSFSARLLVDTDEGATVVASKGTKTINCEWGQIQISNPEAHGLPDGYTELSYIICDGTNKITLPYIPTKDMGIDCHAYIPAKTTSIQCLYTAGDYNKSDSMLVQFSIRPTSDANAVTWWYGNGGDPTKAWNTLTNDINISIRGNSCTFNNETLSAPALNYPIISNLVLTYGVTGNYYFCKYYEGNNLIADLIPAMRQADDIVGLYDIKNNEFYSATEGNNYTAGAIIPKTITIYKYIGTLDEKGTWTITATKGAKTVSDSINIISEKDYNLTLQIPVDKLYLYNEGDKCEAITGGWETVGSDYDWYGTSNYPSRNWGITFNDDNMYINSNTNGQCFLSTKNAIDINLYSKVCVEFASHTTSTESAGTSALQLLLRDSVNNTGTNHASYTMAYAIWNSTRTFNIDRNVIETEIINKSENATLINNIIFIITYRGYQQTNIYKIWLE